MDNSATWSALKRRGAILHEESAQAQVEARSRARGPIGKTSPYEVKQRLLPRIAPRCPLAPTATRPRKPTPLDVRACARGAC